MKLGHTLTLIALLCYAPLLRAQAVTASDLNIDKTPELSEAQREFTNLPEQKRTDYFKHINEASRLFNQKRIFETLEQTDAARKIFDRNSDVFNLIGSCYVEFRDFDKAREFYLKALELSPESSVIMFNIAELDFVTKQWFACLQRLQEVLPMIPESGLQTRRLVEFKILLCYIALGKTQEAKAMAEKYDPLRDDTPFYYYAQASLCYMKKDLIGAEEQLQRANRVFGNPAYISPWQDTLIEFGYIASFYGGGGINAAAENSPTPPPQPESEAR
jgi:tetratricopeptide (TPR) repeat protein